MTDAKPTLRTRITAAAVLLAIAVFAAFALAEQRPPAPKDASAPKDGFSAERAMVHIEEIAKEPRPAGSAAHARVRAYIMGELVKLGWEPFVQEATVMRPAKDPADPPRIATVKNVYARRAGTKNHDAVVLMAHYDSRAMTPGASDDGAGTATLLETARALGDGPALDNDVMLLFTDAEEQGLLGARAFLEDLPEAARVGTLGVVLNFEARGDAGPVLMFETSDGNAPLVAALGAAPKPVTNSLARAIYKLLPNDTDLTVWLKAGFRAMNFANVEGVGRYHAPTDTPAHLDHGTLQQHGDYAVSLARVFGAMDLSSLDTKSDAIFFNFGPLLIRYPLGWSIPIAVLSSVAFFLFLVIGLRKGVIGWRGALMGAAATIGGPVVTFFVCGTVWGLLSGAHPEYMFIFEAPDGMQRLFGAGFVALGIAFVWAAQAFIAKRAKAVELAAGAGFVWTLMAVFMSVSLPEGSFLFVWPLFFFSLGWLFHVVRLDADDETKLAPAILHLVLGIVPVVLFTSLAGMLFAVAYGPLSGHVVAAVAAAGMTLLVFPMRLLLAPDRRIAPALALGAAAVFFSIGQSKNPNDAEHPRPDTLVYAVDADTKKAYWVSVNPTTDVFTVRAMEGATRTPLPAFLPFEDPEKVPVWAKETDAAPEPAAKLVVEKDDTADVRHVVFRVVPPPGALVLDLKIDAAGAPANAKVQGKEVPLLSSGALGFRYTAPPEKDGVVVELDVKKDGPVSIRAVTQRADFPKAQSELVGLRPPELMALPGGFLHEELLESDMTIVSRGFTL